MGLAFKSSSWASLLRTLLLVTSANLVYVNVYRPFAPRRVVDRCSLLVLPQ
jgi:hypothetical protein